MFGREPDYSIIRTTSKEAIKRTALLACGNDIKKATEIYDFFVKDMPNLPDTDPVLPSTFDQVKETAMSIFQWGEANQDKIIGGINLVLQMIGKQPLGAAPIDIVPPPIE
jgi:hypothetical protein